MSRSSVSNTLQKLQHTHLHCMGSTHLHAVQRVKNHRGPAGCHFCLWLTLQSAGITATNPNPDLDVNTVYLYNMAVVVVVQNIKCLHPFWLTFRLSCFFIIFYYLISKFPKNLFSSWQSQVATHYRTLGYWERNNITHKNTIYTQVS